MRQAGAWQGRGAGEIGSAVLSVAFVTIDICTISAKKVLIPPFGYTVSCFRASQDFESNVSFFFL